MAAVGAEIVIGEWETSEITALLAKAMVRGMRSGSKNGTRRSRKG